MGHDGHDHDHSHPHHDHKPHHHKPAQDDHSHAHRPDGARPSGDSPSAKEHRDAAPTSVSTFVITCSDTRQVGTDETGRQIQKALLEAGHTVGGHLVVRDEAAALRQAIEQALASGARAILVNGGTGVGRRDITIETVRPLFEKELAGFGELFRQLSYAEIGSAAMLSRACAGTHRQAVIFALPGSPSAVKVALSRLILPELGHLVRELSR